MTLQALTLFFWPFLLTGKVLIWKQGGGGDFILYKRMHLFFLEKLLKLSLELMPFCTLSSACGWWGGWKGEWREVKVPGW